MVPHAWWNIRIWTTALVTIMQLSTNMGRHYWKGVAIQLIQKISNQHHSQHIGWIGSEDQLESPVSRYFFSVLVEKDCNLVPTKTILFCSDLILVFLWLFLCGAIGTDAIGRIFPPRFGEKLFLILLHSFAGGGVVTRKILSRSQTTDLATSLVPRPTSAHVSFMRRDQDWERDSRNYVRYL